jgi:hypothetical protein
LEGLSNLKFLGTKVALLFCVLVALVFSNFGALFNGAIATINRQTQEVDQNKMKAR